MQAQKGKIGTTKKRPGSCGSERVYGEQKRKRRRCPDAGRRSSDIDFEVPDHQTLRQTFNIHLY